MKTKICTKCNIKKSLSEFHRQKKGKFGVSSVCKECKNAERHNRYLMQKEYLAKLYKIDKSLNPAKYIFKGMKQRCEDKNCSNYYLYGGRGIKCLITEEEIRQLMIRDNYWDLKKPSIDRIDNDGDYTYNNCRFIEQSENSRKRNYENPNDITILQYDLDGNFIREWKSASEVERILGYRGCHIRECCLGKRKTANKFIWKDK